MDGILENVSTGAGAAVETAAGSAAGAGAGQGGQAGQAGQDGAQAANAAAAAAPEAPANAGRGNGQDADPDSRPITDFGKVDLGLDAELVDAELVADFGRQAMESGLTPKQARALAQWQVGAIAKAREKMLADGVAQLNREWGANAAATQRDTLALVANIDRELGDGRFSRALERSGAGLDADIIAGLAVLAKRLGEDRAAGALSQAATEREETVEEGLAGLFKE